MKLIPEYAKISGNFWEDVLVPKSSATDADSEKLVHVAIGDGVMIHGDDDGVIDISTIYHYL